MREKLDNLALAQDNMAAAQHQQRTWYDWIAPERGFYPGQKVLVTLPTKERKLLAKWQGPFEVIKKLGSTTFYPR